MSLFQTLETDLIHKALKRMIVSGANLGAANLSAFLAGKLGIHVAPAEIAGAVFLGLETLRHYLILKYPAWASLLS